MPSLYARVGARGYASGVVAGQTGDASLTATQAVRRPSSSPVDWHRPATTLTGFSPEGPPDVPGYGVIEGSMGLPGELLDPLASPGYGPGYIRTHAAPRPGHAGSYHPSDELDELHASSREIHAADFGMPRHLRTVYDVDEDPVDAWTSNDPGGHTGQAPLAGAQRVLGGMDAVQGYDRRNRFGFDAGHRARQSRTTGQPMSFLDPAERPFIVPQAQGSFTPTDAVQGPQPWVSDLHAESVNYSAPSAYSAPPDPAVLQGRLTEALPGAGWWDG